MKQGRTALLPGLENSEDALQKAEYSFAHATTIRPMVAAAGSQGYHG